MSFYVRLLLFSLENLYEERYRYVCTTRRSEPQSGTLGPVTPPPRNEKRETRKLSSNQKSAAHRFYFSERENLTIFKIGSPPIFCHRLVFILLSIVSVLLIYGAVSRFSFLGGGVTAPSDFSFLVSRFSFLVPRFSFLVSRFSFLVSRFSFLVSRFSVAV